MALGGSGPLDCHEVKCEGCGGLTSLKDAGS